MRRIVIQNKSRAELRVMLEPWTDTEDVEPGGQLLVEGDFSEEELTIDFFDESFMSVWCAPGCTLRKLQA